MQAIEILEREHHLVLHLLECLEVVVNEAEGKGQLRSPHAAEILSLMEFFADGSHQRKEEEGLFSRLLRRAALSQRLYVGRLFADHARDRHDLRSLHSNLMGAVYGDPLSTREFVVRSRRYILSHRKHMGREQVVLYPMAERLLDERDDAMIVRGFAAIDNGLPPGLDLATKVRGLCARVGVGFREERLPPAAFAEMAG